MNLEQGNGSEEALLGNGSTDIIKPRGCMRATTIVGKVANIIRTVVAFGLLAATIALGLIATGALSPDSIASASTAFCIIVAAGCAMVFFDASTAQFLVQVVLTQLSNEVDRLHGIALNLRGSVDRLNGEVDKFDSNNKIFQESLEKKAKQLSIAQKNLEVMKTQIAKQDGIIKDLGMVQANAQNLLQSLMKYGNKTENFDKILTEHVDNLGDTAKIMESLTIKMTNQNFAQMDADGDGKVDSEEFKQWLAGQPQ